MKIKVLICKPTAELPRYYEFYDSLSRMVVPPNTEEAPIHSSSPAKNRNVVIKKALEYDYTHIFFTDDDHVYLKETLMRLLSHGVDIVSGIYTMKFPPFPIVALNNPNDQNMSSFVNMNEAVPDENGLLEVPRVPAGCLLVTTEALRNIEKYMISQSYPDFLYREKWFTLGHIQPDEWGDDLWFCDRSREAGYKIYLDTKCPVGHITKCVLWPYFDEMAKEWKIQFKINEGYRIGTAPTEEELLTK